MSPAPAASLHIGLLAAKGTARPSRGVAQPLVDGGANQTLHFRELVTERAAGMNSAAPRRIAVSLDDRQRLRLRLASAHLGKSRQAIIMDALEHYLTEVVPNFLHGPCSCIGGTRNGADPCCQEKP